MLPDSFSERADPPRHSYALFSFHWLPTEQKIEYKLFLCCFKVIFHQAPIYILELQYIIILAL